jgi:hypothetical protein
MGNCVVADPEVVEVGRLKIRVCPLVEESAPLGGDAAFRAEIRSLTKQREESTQTGLEIARRGSGMRAWVRAGT